MVIQVRILIPTAHASSTDPFMVDHPHHRKHAFDLGEYGAGYMSNSLAQGCDCKGSIEYLDASFVRKCASTNNTYMAR